MTALMSKNPKTGSEQALDNGIEGPQRSADWSAGNILGCHIVVEDVESGGKAGEIPSYIAQTS